VEPLPFSSLVQELHQHPQTMSTTSLSCALCGTLVARLPSATAMSRTHSTNGSSWFKYPLALGSGQNHNAGTRHPAECEQPGQVYIFRLAASTTSAPPPALTPAHTSSASMPGVGPSSRPTPPLNTTSSSRVIQAQTQNSPYPLCTSNYCLTRLRSTCSLWAFVRVGIVERIWEEEVVQSPKPLVNGETREAPSPLTTTSAGNQPANGKNLPLASEKPPVPPRRRRLWEMASALGERAASWGKEGAENFKEKEKESTKKLPTPPPSHPSALHPHAAPTSPVEAQDPPTLPKRKVVRTKVPTDVDLPPSGTQEENGIAAPETKESAANVNGHHDTDKADPSASDSPPTPVDEITFTTPPSPRSSTTSQPAESSAPLIQDHPPPPSPQTVPLPLTPTMPNPIARVTSPVPRPHSRVSPASPPPQSTSRPVSPAISRSRTGSPAPAGIARATPPSPGHPPSASHVWGKTSASSPLASSSRPASPGPCAPPLPRRAAARRAVPPPPKSGPKEGGKEEVVSSVATDSIPGADVRKESEAGVAAETNGGDGREATVLQAAPVPASTAEAAPGPEKNVTVGDVEGPVNGATATAVCDPLPLSASEGDGCPSVDTASTKHSSSTEGEGFASDATWEERTWKELVRLKEDMFWARIGGIRALQG